MAKNGPSTANRLLNPRACAPILPSAFKPIIAIERDVYRAAFATAPTCGPPFEAEGRNAYTHHVGCSPQNGVSADKALVGGATEGAGEGEVRTRTGLFRRHEALQLLEPVLHDDDLRRGGRLFDFLDHQEALAIGRYVIRDAN